jgi:hypothetical protein
LEYEFNLLFSAFEDEPAVMLGTVNATLQPELANMFGHTVSPSSPMLYLKKRGDFLATWVELKLENRGVTALGIWADQLCDHLVILLVSGILELLTSIKS